MNCKECVATNDESFKFCGECGYDLLQDSFCTQCGKPLKLGANFCVDCGTKVGSLANLTVSGKVLGASQSSGNKVVADTTFARFLAEQTRWWVPLLLVSLLLMVEGASAS
jgi:predicted amidophosphoribosyltransferase